MQKKKKKGMTVINLLFHVTKTCDYCVNRLALVEHAKLKGS